MAKNASLTWRLGIASLSLLAAITVYRFARLYPPELLESFQATNPLLASQTVIFGSAPSFFYTLALGLVIGVCASTLTNARVHCLAWIGLALCLEISQHSVVAEPLSSWLSVSLTDSIWSLIGPYWTRGAFDLPDLIATLAGGLIALAMLTQMPTENSDEGTS